MDDGHQDCDVRIQSRPSMAGTLK